MVGGMVIEVAEVKGKPHLLFIDSRDMSYTKDTCAIMVEKNPTSRLIEIGDQVWWDNQWAYWTPQRYRKGGVSHKDYDIKIPRIGYAGINHPAREGFKSAGH